MQHSRDAVAGGDVTVADWVVDLLLIHRIRHGGLGVGLLVLRGEGARRP
jgi:hypothetical protein